MGLTLLSDFDGVWTNQRSEADAIMAVFEAELSRLSDESEAAVAEGLAKLGRRVDAEPSRFGWAPDGRITAYVDEDPLLRTNAYAAALLLDEDVQRYRDVVLAEYGTIRAFGDHCFITATRQYVAQRDPAMVDGAQAAMQALIEAGHRVVVVSNSDAAKVVPWLRSTGIDAGVDDGEVRVVGDARKWELGAGDDGFDVSGRRVLTDRPAYRAVIERVNPDVIIGDVFSLDLALPHRMRSAGDPSAPSQLALRRHAHSPQWVIADRAGGAIDHVVHHPSEMLDVMQRLQGRADA